MTEKSGATARNSGKKGIWALYFIIPLAFIAIGVLLIWLLNGNGSYPDGADTMYHLYRGDAVYKGISKGDLWLSLDPAWYNGAQLLRYEAPLSAYIIAACIAIAGGNVLRGYLFYVFFLYIAGAAVWFAVGIKTKRLFTGSVLGAVWFLVPSNLYALFVQGDMAFSLSVVIMPFLLYAAYEYLQNPRWTMLPAVTASTLLIVLSSTASGIICAVSLLVFSVIYLIINRSRRKVLDMYLSVLAAFAVAGLWLLPSIIGANGAGSSAESLGNYFQNLWTSINPVDRLLSGNAKYYFGMSLLALAVFGALCSAKKTMAGFWTAIVIYLCSAASMYAVISFLPGGENLQLLRFFSIAACMILTGFLLWKTLKKPVAVAAVLLICLDIVPSLSLIYGAQGGETPEERLNRQQSATLIAEAQSITNQRLALIDGGSLDSMGAMLVSDWNNSLKGSFGGNAKAASDYSNLSQLDRALKGGNFLYLFDRCMELGNDTVIVAVSEINTYAYSLARLDDAAAQVGYNIIDFNDGYRLYHMDIEGGWGTKARYRAIGIGNAAPSISLTFPTMEETDSANINDYSYEQLCKYDLVYLDGFTYDDREQAEELVIKLSENGVRVVIAADGIPQDSNHSQRFLGVTCNDITFSNGYPELDTVDGLLNTDLFPAEYSKWQTVYLEGLDEVWGSVCEDDGFKPDFYGTVKNDNIVMVGINLTYFYGLTEDPSVGKLLERAMNISSSELPLRRAVPLDITYSAGSIKISSGEDDVNTAVVYQDIFKSGKDIKSNNNLLYVQKGDTVIELKYPYLWQGLLISLAGMALAASLYIFVRKRLKQHR